MLSCLKQIKYDLHMKYKLELKMTIDNQLKNKYIKHTEYHKLGKLFMTIHF